MNNHKNQQRFLLQEDLAKFVKEDLGTSDWVTVYRMDQFDKQESLKYFAAFVPCENIEDLLSTKQWDVQVGFGYPGIEQDWSTKEDVYYPLGSDTDIEPLVIDRHFYSVRPDYVEISEEFRLFHNLYYDKKNNKYIKVSTEDGTEEDVIRIDGKIVQIRLRYLKQYLAFKEICLGIYFELDRHSKYTLEEIGISEGEIWIKDDNLIAEIFWRDLSTSSGHKSFSRMIGKKYILPMPKEDTGIWPYDQPKKYEKFIIGIDENGNPISFTCEEDQLANFFGKNPGAPLYLTFVYFDKKVLEKYYGDPDKYQVLDGYLRCAGLWGLRMDNNHDDKVVVFLGDLGKLPAREQLYWKSFNIGTGGGISETNYKRSIAGEFADPEAPDLVFRQKYKLVNDAWKTKFGWPIFLPLADEDDYRYNTLRIPSGDSQSEFDQQILSLVIMMVDSLNETEINKGIKNPEKDSRGISKIQKWFEENGVSEFESHVEFLRNVQFLRSAGVAHRKGKKFVKASIRFGLDKKTPKEVFIDILEMTINFLDFLDNLCK